jgi:hypothetical protein
MVWSNCSSVRCEAEFVCSNLCPPDYQERADVHISNWLPLWHLLHSLRIALAEILGPSARKPMTAEEFRNSIAGIAGCCVARRERPRRRAAEKRDELAHVSLLNASRAFD